MFQSIIIKWKVVPMEASSISSKMNFWKDHLIYHILIANLARCKVFMLFSIQDLILDHTILPSMNLVHLKIEKKVKFSIMYFL